MGIPTLQNNELPPGEHLATLDEVAKVYGSSNTRRKKLMNGLRKAANNLKSAGVKTIWLNGSFVTGKKEPNDIDGCWDYHDSVDITILDPVFLGDRVSMKKKYGLDFFIAGITEAGSGLPFTQFFQKNRDGEPKGILVVKLGEL
ncbi:Uncharacterised protein [Legionella beliardensis]|uniref:Uncharacterized protein n=1 Tax=Legionella beliardensis TaxID=91822 RepID=A0A378JRC7_9GAMM|nr:hypothetical protein [Legionella beliardensis]STX55751.1 Uncharacterised protein [Legionella beliardensis]